MGLFPLPVCSSIFTWSLRKGKNPEPNTTWQFLPWKLPGALEQSRGPLAATYAHGHHTVA